MSGEENTGGYIQYLIIPGSTLFLRDIGADLGMEGEGDLRKAWRGLVVVADNMCMGEGEVMRRLE